MTDRIDTERLVLRPPESADAEAIMVLAGDWDVARHTALIPHPYERRHADDWITYSIEVRAKGAAFPFAITDRADGRFFGAIELQVQESDGILGYWVGKPFWDRGYVTEAVRAMLDLAFDSFGLDLVIASAFSDNRASIRVQEKVGMVYVGRKMEPAPARGGDREVEMREATREGWKRA